MEREREEEGEQPPPEGGGTLLIMKVTRNYMHLSKSTLHIWDMTTFVTMSNWKEKINLKFKF